MSTMIKNTGNADTGLLYVHSNPGMNCLHVSDSETAYEFQSPSWNETAFEKSGRICAVVFNFNQKQSIAQAIKSALSQDLECFEIVCIDDGSTDGSLDIMIETARNATNTAKNNYKLSILKKKRNFGKSHSWNEVAARSNAEWFAVFDGDDISYPNRLSQIHAIIKKHPSLLAVCTNCIKAINSMGTGERYDSVSKRLLWGVKNGLPPRFWFYGCSAAFRRMLFSERLPDFREDDHMLFWRALAHSHSNRTESICWALDIATMLYSVDTGMTNRLLDSTTAGRVGLLGRCWRNVKSQRKWFLMGGPKMARSELDYALAHCTNQDIIGWHKANFLFEQAKGGSWIERFSALLFVFIFHRKNGFGGRRDSVKREVLKRWFCQFFGLPGWWILNICSTLRNELITFRTSSSKNEKTR